MNEIQKNELNKLKRLLLENKLTTHNKNRLILFIETLEQELQKYKSLYENEKDHTDTLKRIIKKIEEYIKNIDEEEFINTEHYVEILDLLKEIK